jgi:hypothetical protein
VVRKPPISPMVSSLLQILKAGDVNGDAFVESVKPKLDPGEKAEIKKEKKRKVCHAVRICTLLNTDFQFCRKRR